MFHRWAALVLVLALCAMTPKNAAGQTQSQQLPRGHGAGTLGKNYPNPFNPETHITFGVGDDPCTNVGQQHLVTLRILNVLGMPVAYFKVEGPASTAATSDATSLNGLTLSNARLGCGSYKAYWDGNLPNGKEAASGTYLVQLFVDNKLAGTRKIFNSK